MEHARAELSEARVSGQGRVRGLLTEEPAGWARARGAELVDFAALRGGRQTPRAWLEAVAAIEGRAHAEAVALVDALLRRAGLSSLATSRIENLPPFAKAALAVAEVAVAIAQAPGEREVVVPEPPVPASQRYELRRLACELLRDARVILHAREAQELGSLVEREAILEAAAGAEHPATRSVLVRVYGWGAPYETFVRELGERGVTVGGGPVAHVLTVPDGFGPREVLAIAFDAGLDVLEVREA